MGPEPVHPIRVVARRTGLSAHVLRMWEHRYGAVTPARTPTRRRLYSDADIERLQLLQEATRHGHGIGAIASLSTPRLVELLRDDGVVVPSAATIASRQDEHALPQHLEGCLRSTAALDADALNFALQRARSELSLHAWIEQLAMPLLAQIGAHWRHGKIRPVHEHLASAAIRDTLIRVERGGAPRSSQRLVVATPSGQLHELGALAVAATAASQGWAVTYLGPNLASDEIALAARSCNARAVALSIGWAEDAQLPRQIMALRAALDRSVALWLGGTGCAAYATELRRLEIAVLPDLVALRRELQRLAA
jgi:DNA-binding transcriptional MerR regulator/methylmalonyl-CoA mutase cobalamin-binding subunit